MTPTEKSLYAMTRFEIGDDVEIAGVLEGTVTGVKVTTSGEDEYRIFFFGGCGTPTERWIRDSQLEIADDGGPESNVIPFPCACERQVRRQTMH